jgi:serpin B
MAREFFKWTKTKIFLTLLLTAFIIWMGIKLMSTGLDNRLIPVMVVLGFIGFSALQFGSIIAFLVSMVINIFWIYLIVCFIVWLVNKIRSKLPKFRWNAAGIATIVVLLIAIFVGYGFLSLGWNDVLAEKADATGATQAGVQEISDANNRFAIDLYKKIATDPTKNNIFFSPWSISTAMAMVYEGAKGQTATEIQDVFYYPTDDQVRRSSYASMINNMNLAGGKYKLSVANSIWLQEDYPFLDSYKNTIREYYLGKVKNFDLAGDPQGASKEVNSWVSKNTNGKIKDIVSPGMFNEYSRAVLANAIYFKGKWVDQFDKDDTKPEDFTLKDGSKVTVDMMNLRDKDLSFNYYEGEGVQVLEMPYQGDKLSMIVILPTVEITDNMKQRMEYKMQRYQEGTEEPFKTMTMKELEANLTEEKISSWRENMKKNEVMIAMPKYSFETSYTLADHLKEMGMPLAFKWPGADFSGMDGTHELYIQKVLHKAYIDVYEEGTEAAAATVIMMGTMAAMPAPPIEFRADHPFIFLIQETSTGNIMFMGRVNDPR